MVVTTGNAQTEFTLVAGDMTPHDEGYFLSGFDYDLIGNDGVEEHYQGCPEDGGADWEDYERRYQYENRCGEIEGPCVFYDLHNETGEQFGWQYKNAMIMPVCDQKYDPVLEPALSMGYIQLKPLVDTLDEDIKYSYILSPEISNLQSVTIEASPDIGIQADRRFVPYNIEYSTDGGLTFDDVNYVDDAVDDNGGVRKTYTADNNSYFKEIVNASKAGNIHLRFIGNLDNGDLGAYKGQYLKIHKITIVADSASSEPIDVVASSRLIKEDPIKIQNYTVSVEKGQVSVYTISGQFQGRGQSVEVCSGLYVLVTDSGFKKKVFIQ